MPSKGNPDEYTYPTGLTIKNEFKPDSKHSSRKNLQNSFHILEHLSKFVVDKNTMNETKI